MDEEWEELERCDYKLINNTRGLWWVDSRPYGRREQAKMMLEKIKEYKKDPERAFYFTWLGSKKADTDEADEADAAVIGERLWHNVNDGSTIEDPHIMEDMYELFRYAWFQTETTAFLRVTT